MVNNQFHHLFFHFKYSQEECITNHIDPELNCWRNSIEIIY